ncbi:glycoside hydrolase family 3 protein [Paludifilum halophilum]|uniref:beta-N-acetylhexosaminidase n=1 Tax=Paludifilum halophilum TaxID=1642702 RepID=A0A235B2R0_9BACL|nr:glycoside hydrolase family 3 protein [Paludifilum halophilum]OYD06249.1 hypothetical protein CHM34_17465 [Paludifilum halophilum]
MKGTMLAVTILVFVSLVFSPWGRPGLSAASPDSAHGKKGCHLSVDRMVTEMTDEEKVGQLIMAATQTGKDGMPSEQTRRMIREYHIGSVIVYDQRKPAAMARYNNRLQQWAEETRFSLPLLISADLEYGAAQRMPKEAATFPRQMGLGAAGSEHLAEKTARITAREARAVGFNWNYSPVADVNTNPNNPVIGVRAFGEKTNLVSELTAAQIRAYQRQGVIASAKHFPGHGDTEVDSHLGLPAVTYDRETLEKVHLPPFQVAIDAGADSIMTAHVVIQAIDPDLPATLSPKVLDGLLRKEMGYDGIIVTDAMTMHAISENWGSGEAAVMAIQAGADVVMSTGSFKDHVEAVQSLLQAIQSGELSEKRVDESVKRVLKAKCEYRLDSRRYVDPDKAERIVGHSRHRKVADEAGRQAVTLVKNEEGLLPLDRGAEETMVAGVEGVRTLADAVRRESGSRVSAWQSDGQDPTDAEMMEAVRQAETADRVIVATYSQSRLPEGQVKLVKALHQTGKPVVTVSIGLPYDIAQYSEVNAYLATYAVDRWQTPNPTMLEAAIRVIYGEQPGGKLPVHIDDRYPFGSGLRYDNR